MKIIALLFFLPACLLADEIYLKGGSVIRNVQIFNCSPDSVCYSNAVNIQGVRSVPASEVLNTIRASVNPERGMFMAQPYLNDKPVESLTFKTEYPYQAAMLPVGLLCAAVAWDKFETASDTFDEEVKTRQYVIGGIAVVCGVVAVYVAFQPVEVAVRPGSVKLSYRF